MKSKHFKDQVENAHKAIFVTRRNLIRGRWWWVLFQLKLAYFEVMKENLYEKRIIFVF